MEKEKTVIVNALNNWEQYAGLHSRFSEAFRFLCTTDFSACADDTIRLDGDQLYVTISTVQGKGDNEIELEVHRKYIDIQYCINGSDTIGWRFLDSCRMVSKDYDSQKDVAFYRDIPDDIFVLKPHTFSIFFPHDAHAPLIGTETVRKAVVKVAVD